QLALLGLAAGAAAAQVALHRAVSSQVFAEMLLEPWLVNRGLVPYRDYFQHHAPLVTYLLAGALALAPPTPTTIANLYVALIAATRAQVVVVGGGMGGLRVATAAGILFLALQLPLDGATPWFEAFVAAALLGVLPLAGPAGVPASRARALAA